MTSMLSVSFLLLLVLTFVSMSTGENRELSQRKKLRTTVPNSNGNFFIGTQAIVAPTWSGYRVSPYAGRAYTESGFDMLTEFREGVAATGMNHFKFKLSPNVCASYKLSCNDRDISSLTQLPQVTQVAATLRDSRFKWYHIWGYSYSLPNKLSEPFTQTQVNAEYTEIYNWAAHLLQTYRNTGKVFFLGNWEGDWELLGASGCSSGSVYDLSCAPSQAVIDKYIKWTTTRQQAINAAKRDFGTQGVNVFFYIEFNLGDENFADHPSRSGVPRPTILNSVVPSVNPDFVSYSSYKSTNKYMDHTGQWFNQTRVDGNFWAVLNHAQSKLTSTSTDLRMVLGDMTKRVFIGEFSPVNTRDASLFASSAAEVFRAALQWGCPFILHWALYGNDSFATPLIPSSSTGISTFTPLRQLFKDWNDAAKAYVTKNNPTQNQLRVWAIEWFKSKY